MIIIHEIINFLSNILFVVMGGVPILNTIWVFPYIILITLIMLLPFIYTMIGKKTKFRSFISIIGFITFFPLLMVAMGPPLVQMQMLSECEVVSVTVQTENVENQEIDMQQCRNKANFYGDFGEWRIVNRIH